MQIDIFPSKCKLIYFLLNDDFRDKNSIDLKEKKFETVIQDVGNYQ